MLYCMQCIRIEHKWRYIVWCSCLNFDSKKSYISVLVANNCTNGQRACRLQIPNDWLIIFFGATHWLGGYESFMEIHFWLIVNLIVFHCWLTEHCFKYEMLFQKWGFWGLNVFGNFYVRCNVLYHEMVPPTYLYCLVMILIYFLNQAL